MASTVSASIVSRFVAYLGATRQSFFITFVLRCVDLTLRVFCGWLIMQMLETVGGGDDSQLVPVLLNVLGFVTVAYGLRSFGFETGRRRQTFTAAKFAQISCGKFCADVEHLCQITCQIVCDSGAALLSQIFSLWLSVGRQDMDVCVCVFLGGCRSKFWSVSVFVFSLSEFCVSVTCDTTSHS